MKPPLAETMRRAAAETTRRDFGFALAAVGLISLLHFTWLLVGWGGAVATQGFDNLMQVVLPAVAAIACLSAALRQRNRTRAAWLLLSMAALAWAIGRTTWTFYEHVLGQQTPFPSLAHAGLLAFIPLAAAGLLMFPTAPVTGAGRTRAVLDGILVSASLFFISWIAVLGPAFGAPSVTPAAKVIGLVFPIGDLVLATIVFLLAARASAARLDVLVVLWTGLMCITLADGGFAFLSLSGGYATGHPIGALWGLGFLLLALAALTPYNTSLDARKLVDRSTLLGATVPYLPLIVAAAVAVWLQVREGTVDPVLFWSALAIAVLVVGRQLATLLENLTLNRRLAKIAAFKTELLQFVSHEMGGPLTPITLQLKLLQAPGKAPVTAEQRHAYNVMQRNLDRLSVLLGDVLETVRLDAGKMKIVPAPTDLRQLVREGLDALRPQAEAKGIQLIAGNVSDATVLADPGRIGQVLYNLLSNSLKFTNGAGSVTVHADAMPGEVVVRVADTGIGMDAAQAASLFQPFSRPHDRPGGSPGTGLGLYICKGIVERHGGRMWVESRGPGLGASFCFTLPTAAPA